jgi:hypothetical protein
MGVYGLGMCRPVLPGHAWRPKGMCVSMTWVMRVAWGCEDLYDLGCMCGLGILGLYGPGLHVWPRDI